MEIYYLKTYSSETPNSYEQHQPGQFFFLFSFGPDPRQTANPTQTPLIEPEPPNLYSPNNGQQSQIA